MMCRTMKKEGFQRIEIPQWTNDANYVFHFCVCVDLMACQQQERTLSGVVCCLTNFLFFDKNN